MLLNFEKLLVKRKDFGWTSGARRRKATCGVRQNLLLMTGRFHRQFRLVFNLKLDLEKPNPSQMEKKLWVGDESLPSRSKGLMPAAVQYFKNEATGVGSSCLRPWRNSNSMRNCASIRRPPALRMRTAAAAEVPPVASKSSTSTICSPALIASMCISISASPYSSE